MSFRVFSILMFLCSSVLFGQTVRHSDQLTSYDGLGHETVFTFCKDHTGLLWLGTNKGVRSYNGHTVGKMQCAADMGFVYSVAETEDGRLLAGSTTGLYEIDRQAATAVRVAAEVKDVRAIWGPLVGGTGGLWMKQGDRYRIVPIESSVISKGNAVTDIIPDGKGGAWVCTAKRLVHLSPADGKMLKFSIADSLLTGNMNRICLVANHIYIGTRNDGLLVFDTETRRVVRHPAVPSSVIADVDTDGKRYVYVATDGNGAYTLDVKTGEAMRHEDVKTVATYTFRRDPQLGIDFFGYYLEGFSHQLYTRHLVGCYQGGGAATDLSATRSFCRHGKMMAVGTRQGLCLIDEQSGATHVFSADQLGASTVTNIAFFAGRFVVATFENGLRVLSTDGQLSALQNKGSFSTLCPSPDGHRLFAISNMGVTILDEQLAVVKHFSAQNSELPDDYLTDITFDHTGKAWIGSLSRLCVYDPLLQTIQATGFPEGFFNSEPSLKFAQAADGDMLAWSGRKVYKAKIDFSGYEEIPLCTRLHIEDISFIRWHGGKYWIGTEQGLFVVDKDFSSHALHLSEADGLPSIRFQSQEWQTTADGTVWMATDRGIVMVSPRQQQHLNDSVPGHVVMNNTVWTGSKLSAFQPLLLNYSTDVGKMYEYTLDGQPPQACTDGEMVNLPWQRWGWHKLSVWLMGHPETATEWEYLYLPSPMFWAVLLILILIELTIWLARREAVDTYKAVEDEKKRQAEEARQAKLYERQRLSDEECALIYNKVEKYLHDTQCYTDPSLRIGHVAAAIGQPQAKLSQVFSRYAQTSFADYVNRLRVNEFKQRVQNPQYNQYTTVALAEMCGLKKSAFFAAFKKYEGCTPNEFLKKLET